MACVIKPIPSLSEDVIANHELTHKAFLSHEGAEKRTIVDLLRRELRGHGIPDKEVFYDEYMTPGGNRDEELETRLKDGLLASEFLIVFLTPAFLEKKWPLWELRTFLHMMEQDRRRKLLPVFYKVSAGECGDMFKQRMGGGPGEKRKDVVESSRKGEELRWVLEKVKKQVGIDAEGKLFSDAEVVTWIMKAVFQVDISSDRIKSSTHHGAHDAATCSKPLCEYPMCADSLKWDLEHFFAVPPLPSHTRLDFENFERPERMLRDKILLEGSNAVAAVGVKGMGGVGKTTCLIGVANNDQVREAFPDGVLWIQLSKETKVEEKMREVFVNLLKYSWCHWSGRNPEVSLNPRTSLDQIVDSAGEALEGKRCLIVLDDFWPFKGYTRSIYYFKRILSNCNRILLSTRYDRIVRGFNADQTDVGDLDDETASALFDDWCGESASGEKQENLKKEILELCSNMALAVSIAGSSVREIARRDGKERGLERVLKKLKGNLDSLQVLDHTRDDQTLNAIMQTTIDSMTDEGHKNAYQRLAVFTNKVQVPNQALEALWGVDLDCVEDRVDHYIACSLATRKVVLGPGGSRSFYVEFHDQHLAYARRSCCRANWSLRGRKRRRSSEEKDMLSKLHAQLVDGYEELHENVNARVWWEAEEADDGYFRENYVRHLAMSGRVTDLVELLTDYRWIAMRCRRQEMMELLGDFGLAVSTLERCQIIKRSKWRRLDFDGRSGGSEEPTAAGDTGTGNDKALGALLLIHKALLASQATLWERRDEIPFQLVGRLQMQSSESALIKKVIDGARQWEQRAWLCPVKQCFESPASGPFLVLHSKSRVTSVALVHKKHHLVTYGTADGHVRMWDRRAGRYLWSLKAHEDSISSLAVEKDGCIMASGSRDKTVRLWNVESGECKRVLRGHESWVGSVAMTEDGSVVVSGSVDNIVRLWNVECGQCKRVLCGHGDAVRSVAVTEDGSVVVSGSADNTVRLWDVRSGECKRVLRGHEGRVNSVSMTEDGSVAVSCSADSTVRLWDVASGECKRVLLGHEGCVDSVSMTEDGSVAVSGSRDKTVRLWNVGSGECKGVLQGHEGWVNSVSVTEDGSVAASGSADKTVRLWNVDSGECKRMLQGHESRVRSVAVAEDGGIVVSGSADKTVQLWNLESGECQRMLHGHDDEVWSVAVTKDGSVVVSGSADRTVRLWSVGSGECKGLLQGHEDWVRSVAVLEDRKVVVSGSDDKTIRLWDVESGECRRVLRGHKDWVSSVAITEDGDVVVSGSYDMTARLWDVESGECLKIAVWAVNRSIAFGGQDLLRWALSVGFLTTDDGDDFSYSGRWGLLRGGNEIEVEYKTVKIMRNEDSTATISATFDGFVQSALVVNWKGNRKVIVVGSFHVFVLEIRNLEQLENKIGLIGEEEGEESGV